MAQMMEFSDKDFKATIVTMLNHIKKNVFLLNEKIGNVNR